MATIRSWLIACIFFPVAGLSQQYTATDIKAKADAELHKLVNDDIFSQCRFSENGYYGYKDDKGELQWGALKDLPLKGKPLKIGVYYTLDYHYSKCRLYDSISGRIFLGFDENGNLVAKPDLSFIPPFMMKGENCMLMSKEEAIEIAKRNGKKADIHTIAGIFYLQDKQTFLWHVSHMGSADEARRVDTNLANLKPFDMDEFWDWNFSVNAETSELLDEWKLLHDEKQVRTTILSDN